MIDEAPLWFRDPDAERALRNYLLDRDNAYERWKFRSVRKLLPRTSPGHGQALDYGCGGGQHSVWLARKGWQVTAADASECSMAACRLHADRSGVAGKLEPVLNPGPDYWAPFNGRRFDLILAKDVIEHIDDDIEFLRQVKAHLAPAGTAVITTQNDASWNYWAQAPSGLQRDPSWLGWDDTHVRFYNLPSLKGKLLHAGLAPVGWRATYFMPYRDWMWRAGLMGRFTRLTQRLGATSLFHLPEIVLGGVYPFCGLGWSIAVLCKHGTTES